MPTIEEKLSTAESALKVREAREGLADQEGVVPPTKTVPGPTIANLDQTLPGAEPNKISPVLTIV
ncbi:MAG: hypothetical protein DDT19_02176 [Syntrophomonadaceae bacterium]|nr:hypothetical protein [Bacillota bacterium]